MVTCTDRDVYCGIDKCWFYNEPQIRWREKNRLSGKHNMCYNDARAWYEQYPYMSYRRD